MKAGIRTLVLMAVAVGLALVLQRYSGNVLILVPPWRIELSLTLAVLLGLSLFIGLHMVLRLLRWAGHAPQRLRAWRGLRAEQRDQILFESGWLHVLQGRSAQAQKTLSKLLARRLPPQRQVLAALALAQSHHQDSHAARCDQALERARVAANTPQLHEAVALHSAALWLEQGRAQDALAVLQTLNPDKAHHPHAARLLLQTYCDLGQHDQAYALIRLLRRRGVLDKTRALAQLETVAAARLAQGGSDAFKALWHDLKPDEKALPAVALEAAKIADAQGRPAESARLLEDALQGQLDARLLAAYVQCSPEHVAHRLGKAESWIKTHPDHPGLYTALGQLCLTGQLWGQAERYLLRSLHLQADAQVMSLLGALYDHLGRPADAARYWRMASGVGLAAVTTVLPVADTRADPYAPDAEPPSAPVLQSPADYPIEPEVLKEKHEP